MPALRHLTAKGALAALLVLLPALSGILAADPGPSHLSPSPLEPASTGGFALVEHALAKLSQHRRLLVVGAHPDDEDTAALTRVVRGLGGEAAYLSLSRGEGGQNLIGPELGVELGLLRTRELLAAREIDGARQFFTRAFDFGYTRSLDETFEKWPRELLLEDSVRVVRRFRPQVIVSVFPADARAGHGQHQAAGVVAHQVFERAGEPGAMPVEPAEGEGPASPEPWAPAALFRATWWDRDATTLETELGLLDPLSGRSLYQLAMASRSQHRSQDMGQIQPLGPAKGRYAWVAGPGGPGSDDLFSGIDTSLEAIAALLTEDGAGGKARATAAAELAAARELAEATRTALTPQGLGAAALRLAEILGRLRGAHQAVAALPEAAAGRQAALALLDEKLDVAQAGLAAAAGLAFDAWTESGTAIPGNAVRVEARAWHASRPEAAREGGGREPLTVEPVALVVTGAVSWDTVPAREEGEVVAPAPGPLAPGALAAWAFYVTAPQDARPTAPYFLVRPLEGALYDWSATPPELRGEPFEPPPLVVRFLLRIGGQPVAIDREVVRRVADQAVGEVRRPLRVAPRLEVRIEPELVVWSGAEPPLEPGPRSDAAAGGSRREALEVRVALRSNAPDPLAGRLRLEVPPGWRAPDPVDFEIAEPGAETAVRLSVRPPEDLPRGRYALTAVADLGGGLVHRQAFPLVDYPHVRPTPHPRPATVEVAAADIRLPALGAVGFVPGASDRLPRDLAAVGLLVETLTGRELAERDLTRFDAIVVGSRAYETDPGLARANGRLLEYVRGGGLVIVLYQQYSFFEGGFAPYPLAAARPHDRVTDEQAPVTLLRPDHPAFTTPNLIGPEDWEGWVQERGLYFAREWNEAYTALVELPAEAEGSMRPGSDSTGEGGEQGETQATDLRGGLLVADVGEGKWVYTGLSFFRQLPAGVTGAYRLFANLLGLADPGTARRAERGGAGGPG